MNEKDRDDVKKIHLGVCRAIADYQAKIAVNEFLIKVVFFATILLFAPALNYMILHPINQTTPQSAKD